MIVDIVSSVFLILGALMAFTAALGVFRFPDTLSRMHAATKPQTFGLLQILLGAIIQLGDNVDVGMLILSGLFAIITAPVIAHRIGRLVYQEQRAQDGLIAKERLDRGDID